MLKFKRIFRRLKVKSILNGETFLSSIQKITIFWDVTSYRLVDVYRHFTDINYLHQGFIRFYIPRHGFLHNHHHENHKYHRGAGPKRLKNEQKYYRTNDWIPERSKVHKRIETSLSNYLTHRRKVRAYINCLGLIIYYKPLLISSKIMHVDSFMIRQLLKLRPNHSSLRARNRLQIGGSVQSQNIYLSLAW